MKALLDAVLADPDDEAPRLVYADALLQSTSAAERARGEFIVAQCKLAKLTEDAPGYWELYGRQQALLEKHENVWTAELDPYAGDGTWGSGTFARGFVELARVPVEAFVEHGDAICARAPIRAGRFYYATGPRLPQLAASPHLARLRALELSFRKPDAAAFASFIVTPALAHLVELGIPSCKIKDAGAVALAGTPWFRKLVRANLDYCLLTPKAAAALFGSGKPLALAHLRMQWNRLVDAGAQALSAAKLANLVELDLTGNGIGPAGAAALAESRTLRSLRTLDVSANKLGDKGASALAASPHLRGLRSLAVGINKIRPAGLAALLASPITGALEQLELYANPIGDKGAAVLAGSPVLAHLRKLNLGDCKLTDAGGRALAASPYAHKQLAVSMYSTQLAPDTVSAMKDTFANAYVD